MSETSLDAAFPHGGPASLGRSLQTALVILASLLVVMPARPAQSAPPTLLEFAREDTLPDGTAPPFRNGDTVRLWTRWDQDSLSISADFACDSCLSPDDLNPTVVERLASGVYRLVHVIPETNPRPDSTGIPIPLTAVAADDSATTDRSIRVCLSNHPPQWLSSRILNPKEFGYRGGDSLRIETVWASEDRLLLSATVDLRALQPEFDPARDLEVRQHGDSTFELAYRIPINEEDRAPDGENIVLPVFCRDAGCGIGLDHSIRITLDTETDSSAIPVLDPLPPEVSEVALRVSGTARGTGGLVPHRVAIVRDDILQGYTTADSITGRFEIEIALGVEGPLLEGRHKITAWSEDPVGNRTRSSTPIFVTLVLNSGLIIPRPFTSGEDVLLRDPAGMTEVSVRIFDLEGDCLRRWREPGPLLEMRLNWDGTGEDGDRLSPGPYLVRAEWRSPSGRSHHRTQGLLFQE